MNIADIFVKIPEHWKVLETITIDDVEYTSRDVTEESTNCETCEFACCDDKCLASAKLSPCVQRIDDAHVKVFVWRKNELQTEV